MKLENREAKLDARPILGRMLLLAAFGLFAGVMLAMSASPALAQESQESQQGVCEPEKVTLTGVIQSEETRFVLDRFFLVDEQSGIDRTLASLGPDEGGVVLSELVGERVRITGIPQTRGNPPSDFENFNDMPVLVTALEVLGEGGKGGEGTPVEEPCDADTLTRSQYAECTATKEEITSGGSGDGKGTPTVASKQGITVLPDTGGLELPVLVGGLTLILGGLVLRKRMS